MGLREDVQTLRARQDLTPAQKRSAAYDLKGQAIVNHLTPKVGQVFTRGPYTVTLTKNPEYDGGRLIFPGISLTKNGNRVPLSLPLTIVNPPILVPDGAGGLKEDLLQVVRDMLMDLAG